MKDISIDGISRKGAMNAAVEAAWSGDTRKGLSVMAAEIQKLADGLEKAAQEIKDRFASGDDLTAAFCKAAELSREIATASGELRAGMDQIRKAYIRHIRLKQAESRLFGMDSTADKGAGPEK